MGEPGRENPKKQYDSPLGESTQATQPNYYHLHISVVRVATKELPVVHRLDFHPATRQASRVSPSQYREQQSR